MRTGSKVLEGLLVLIFLTMSVEADELGVKFRELAKGGFSTFQQPVQLVITNQTQWEKVWGEHSSARQLPPMPKVDFGKETVVFIGLGQKRSGGYSVRVESVESREGKLIVHAITREPRPGAMSIQAITAPFCVVAIEAKAAKVEVLQTGEQVKNQKN